MSSRFFQLLFFNCFCISAFAQIGFDNFSVSDDGKIISWSDYDSGYKVHFAQMDSMLNSSTYTPRKTKITAATCRISGDGKHIYILSDGTLKIADIGKDSIVNEKIIYEQKMYTGVFD